MTQPGPPSLRVFKSDGAWARYMAAYDAVLRVWPIVYEELDLPTRLGSTHVIAGGPPEAPPLVLLSCMSGSATVWRPNVEGLSRHFRTYAVDVIGQAGKSVASRRTLNRRDVADWFTDLLDTLGVERTSIVGNSYGGFLALNQASLTPPRVDRVVLIDPAGTFWRLPWKFFYVMLLLVLTRNTRTPDIADWLGADVTFDPSDAPWRAQMSLAMSGAGFSRPPNVVSPVVFSTTELQAIHVPTLLLIGDKESLYEPHTALQSALDRMPGLAGEIVPDAHHIAAMARPEYANERIVRFLNGSGGVLPRSRRV